MEQGRNRLAPGLSIAALGLAVLLAAGATALGEPVGDPANGTVMAPAGYVARAAPSRPGEIVFIVTKQNEDAPVCRIEFQALPEMAQFDQVFLNRMTDKSDWARSTGQGLAEFYDVRSVDRFEHAGVRGAAITGVFSTANRCPLASSENADHAATYSIGLARILSNSSKPIGVRGFDRR